MNDPFRVIDRSSRAAASLAGWKQRLVEFERRQVDLLLEIAEAEDRGDWPRAAQLREERHRQRVAASHAVLGRGGARAAE